MEYRGLIISDIHVGAFDVEKQYKEYHDIFLDYIRNLIKKNKTPDFIIITGDFFDYKFYLNDKESTYAYRMLKELSLLCEDKTKIRIVYGTESHECNQYDMLDILHFPGDIKVIKTVSSEELLPNMNVLYLPEEHMYNKHDHYKDYLYSNNSYDYIFGHGVIREIMKKAAESIESDTSNRLKVPAFNSGELSDICKGNVFFGHYHIRYNIDDKIFSVGSFSRWEFGQEEEKGFYEVTYNPSKEKYTYKFHENTLAEKFVTVGFGYNSKVFTDNDCMQKELSKVDKMIDDGIIDHIRFEFNIPEDVENPEATINYIKERYKFNDYIKVEITNGYAEKKRQLKKEKVKEDNDKYGFIYDESLPIEEKVHRCISIKYSKDIPIKHIDLYLHNSLDEIYSKYNCTSKTLS